MTNEELVEEIQNGVNVSENMARLYTQNKWLMVKMIRRYTILRSDQKELEKDLMQEAYLGLDQAVRAYDSSYGKFMSYAWYWIRQRVVRYIHNNCRTIRIPAHEIGRMSHYHKVVNDYVKDHNEKPSEEYIRHKLGISQKSLKNLEQIIEQYTKPITSLDETFGEDDDTNLYDVISSGVDVEAEVLRVMSEHDTWEFARKYMTKEEFDVVWARYGESRTLVDIAEEKGVTYSKVKHIELTALRKPILRSRLIKDMNGGK